jgi:peptide/nickel transport system permease protein
LSALAVGPTARAIRHPSFALGAVLTLALLATAAVSLAWTPYSPYAIAVRDKLALPSAAHAFGTDSLGRDVASLVMAGSRTSILVGVVAVGVGLSAGTALGLLAAARRGWVEELVMRAADLVFAFPAVLSAIMLTAVVGPGIGTSIAAIGVFNVPIFARVARGSARAVHAREFVLAARTAGRSELAITLAHVLPNILPALIIQATIQFANAILWEAALSYLGLGTQPPNPSWGRLLNDAQAELFRAPWLAVFPGLAIVLSVLGLNLLGDGLRDLLDPRLARRR